MDDPTKRFSDRASNYVKYRPHYPKGLVDALKADMGLDPSWTVADVGSGTGISSEPFLDFGCAVIGIEPNKEMRQAAERYLGDRPAFKSRDGRAEATGLDAESIDLFVSGQAFHWFDRAAARAEALRFLREPKRALLMWNDWRPRDSSFLRDYGSFLDARMPGRKASDHRALKDSDFDAFFGRGRWKKSSIPNPTELDFEGLKGRLLSASYAPRESDPGFSETVGALRKIFDRHARDGRVGFAYATILYSGRIGP
jgi:SAM-dependent methyltransferase